MKRKEARGNLPVEFADVSKAAYLISFSPALKLSTLNTHP
jgi:hypothetical protein